MSERATRPLCAESQSLRNYLETLPAEDVIRISDPIDINYRPTALVLELENRRQTPIVMIDRPIGFGMPVVTNLFASRDRIARMVGAEPGGFNEAWTRALANLLPAKIVDTGAVQEVVRIESEIDEFEIAGALLGQPIELVKCKTIDVEVPAQAEIVIEGEILADQHEEEGPFGEYTGYSTFRSTKNVFVVKAITHRTAPIFHDIIPGYSMEHLLLGRAAKEAHAFMRLKEMHPGIKALTFPKSGTHFHAYMSFKKTAECQARQALMLLLGLDSYLKLVIAVDEDVNVFNEEEVLWAVATRFQADTDMFMVPDVFCNRLDPSSRDGMSGKLALYATAPLNSDVGRAIG